MRQALTPLVCSFVLATGGCAGSGNLSLSTYGEDFIEAEIPAAFFADGWTVSFDRFLVSFAAATVADAADVEAAALSTPTIMDLKAPGPIVIEDFGTLPAQRFDNVSVVVAPDADAVAGSASADNSSALIDGGHSVLVQGSASKGDDTATFTWAFDTATLYAGCETEEDGQGVVVRADEDNEVQLTIHGDHLFYDDLASEDAVLRFDAIFAADGADGSAADGDISEAELQAVDLTSLPIDQYGNAGAAETLFDFINALSRTLVHLNGEGECSISSP